MSLGYRERHTKMEIIPCFALLVVISVAAFVIIDTGFNSDGGDNVDRRYSLRIQLYSGTYDDLTGTIELLNDDVVYEILNVTDTDIVFSSRTYKGSYTLYYQGNSNGAQFGPITISITDVGLILDQQYFDVRITINVLGE